LSVKSKKRLYNVLDIEETASKEEIKKAYRKRARETHPDTNKGKEEEFIDVNKAYLVLADDLKRSKYDQTGQEDFRDNISERAMGLLSQLFTDTIAQCNEELFYIDIMKVIKDTIVAMEQNQKKIKEEGQKRISFLEKLLPKIKNKGDKPVFESVIQKLIQGTKMKIAQIEDEEKVGELALLLLQNYSFETLEREVSFIKRGTMTFTNHTFT